MKGTVEVHEQQPVVTIWELNRKLNSGCLICFVEYPKA